MYLNLQGFADTTAAQTGNNLVHFSYQLGKFFAVGGGDRDLKTVTMPTRTGVYQPYILFAGSTSYIHLICDYGKLLNGVNFKTQDSIDTHAGLNNAASIIAGNIPNMFHYEE